MKKFILLTLALLTPLSLQAEERMISAGFGVTEIIYALGAQDKLVAADFTSRHLIKNDDTKQLGLHVQLSAEGVLALRPTHLIGTDEMGPKNVLEQIRQSGVQVVTIPSGQDTSQLFSRLDKLAEIMEMDQEVQQLKEQVELDISKLQEQRCDNQPRTVFLMLDGSGKIRVGGSDTAINSIITLAGGSNPAHTYFSGYKTMNMESLLEMQPDYILISQRALDMYQGIDNLLDKVPILKATPAGINKQVITIPSGSLLGGFGLASIDVAKGLNQHLCD
ncbi:heme/hemin ABC transporter substrate-binding protein [Vibrio cholerae]|uniref:heme/hemin ABC transporter substrate-binding protein n=1 Tax=Vibrio cholerae TaxID=666 RepID=UPI0011DAD044|nr:ABC transporter substrate-binding protein [Vibrio cholerae]TXX82405.1 ABC transporter substrate-binding protein [Vibrio cholerae]GHY48672.1 hemin receptor [Vibrio cholerae]GIA58859.1 hemin receptor [Vibrio cholerae]